MDEDGVVVVEDVCWCRGSSCWDIVSVELVGDVKVVVVEDVVDVENYRR